jgi:hypothetical protein
MRRLLAFGAGLGAIVLSGCAGGGTGDIKPNSNIVVAYSQGPGHSGTISFTGNSWKAHRSGSTITVTTPTENGDQITLTTPNPVNIPSVFQPNQITLQVTIDGATYTPAGGFTLTVSNASGNFAGTFSGPMTSAAGSIEVSSGTFLVQF